MQTDYPQEAMKETGNCGDAGKSIYEGSALIADPIHGYITFTVPYRGVRGEKTEKDLIDSSWVQRLRNIFQLQSARWVFPSAEHSRFQHSLGAMHIAGRFAFHLYPSLKEVIPKCPSRPYIEELLRIAALLHDIGHGPFGHFFDDNFLSQYGATHEDLSQRIVIERLGEIISKIKRSPNGIFAPDERLDPRYVAYLIKKDQPAGKNLYPEWLTFLQPLLGGIYTVDNLDYVLRDSYMCGVTIGPVDLNRLIHYTFFTKMGLTLHKAGGSALNMFLNARLYLYSNVYYHRTTRAIDLHLREIFPETMKFIFHDNPATNLDKYLQLTDWSLQQEIKGWEVSRDKKKRVLYEEWKSIFHRDPKWKMAYDTVLSLRELEKGRTIIRPEEMENKIRELLRGRCSELVFKVDMASHDPRPINPLSMGNRQIYIYNPSNKKVSKEPLREFFDYIPAKVIQCRIFTLNHDNDALLSEIAEKALGTLEESIKTNV